MEYINDEEILSVLRRMHNEAGSQGITLIKGLMKGVFRKLRPQDMKDAYIGISKHQGEFLYDLILKNKMTHIVEFGTSFGISTIYLAAAAKANNGKVITTELLPEKAKIARSNFNDAGLSHWIELLEGDALTTLVDVSENIDFLLLDGWNDLYLPLVRMLESKFKKGTLIYTDNVSFKSAKPYLNYIQENPLKYKSKYLKNHKGGSELTEYIWQD